MRGPRVGRFLGFFSQKSGFVMISGIPEAIVDMVAAFDFRCGKAVRPWLEGNAPQVMSRIERINHG